MSTKTVPDAVLDPVIRNIDLGDVAARVTRENPNWNTARVERAVRDYKSAWQTMLASPSASVSTSLTADASVVYQAHQLFTPDFRADCSSVFSGKPLIPVMTSTPNASNQHASITVCRGDTPFLATMSPSGVPRFPIMESAIESLNLSDVHTSVAAETGWDHNRLLAAESSYRDYLLGIARNPSDNPSPSRDADEFWHQHVLHPRYAHDCNRVFGGFLDHVPETAAACNCKNCLVKCRARCNGK